MVVKIALGAMAARKLSSPASIALFKASPVPDALAAAAVLIVSCMPSVAILTAVSAAQSLAVALAAAISGASTAFFCISVNNALSGTLTPRSINLSPTKSKRAEVAAAPRVFFKNSSRLSCASKALNSSSVALGLSFKKSSRRISIAVFNMSAWNCSYSSGNKIPPPTP